MSDMQEEQNNPLPLYPLTSSSAGPSDPHLQPGHCTSLPALNRPIHQECAQASTCLWHLRGGSSTTLWGVGTHSSGLLLQPGERVLAWSTVKVFAGDISDCLAPHQSQIALKKPRQARGAWAPLQGHCRARSWCSHQQSHLWDSLATLHKVLMNLRAFSPRICSACIPLLLLPTRALTRLSCWNDVAVWLWVQLASTGKSF